MIRTALSVIAVLVLTALACGLPSQSLPQTQPPVPTQVIPVTAPTDTLPVATDTAAPTEPPTLAPTATATAFVPATLDPASATLAVEMGSMGNMMNGSLSLYLNPVGTPVKSWNGVPIMPQATSGQEYPNHIYSYIATATLNQARQFYAGKSASMGFTGTIGTGYSGSGSKLAHNIDFLSFALSIILTSYDNDTGHVIVVISKAP